MFRLFIVSLVLFTTVSEAQIENKELEKVATPLDKLEQLHWKNRVLLILEANPSKQKQVAGSLQTNKKGIQERDLLWFHVGKSEIFSNISQEVSPGLIREVKSLLSEGSQIVLLGKDGDVKYRSTKLDLQEVFSRIDSMPMRRVEMQRRKSNSPQ